MSQGEAVPDQERIDLWLWSVRLYKTRSEAADACRSGAVTVNGQPAKPARSVRLGDIIIARQGLIRKTSKVLLIPRSRIGAKLVAAHVQDLTSPEDYERTREQRIQHLLLRPSGKGRPTKKERRAMDDFFESQ